MELIGLFLIASGLLVIAGVAKSLRPDDTARALAVLASSLTERHGHRIAQWRLIVRFGAAGEAAIGLVAIVFPRPPTAALVGVSYVMFACVVAVARRKGGPLATCGCFGRPDTSPTLVHLALNVVFATSAVAVAVGSSGHSTLAGTMSAQPALGIPLIFVSSVGVALSVLAMSSLGALEGARQLRRGAAPS